MTLLIFFAILLAAGHGVQATDCPGASQVQPLYRDYNPTTSDHFYTTDQAEAEAASGYNSEGIKASVFTTAVDGTLRLQRFWNAGTAKHFYTANTTEAQIIETEGWALETQNPIFVYSAQVCNAVPLYRLYNSALDGHLFTIDAGERDESELEGYAFELIAGYAYPASATAAAKTTTTKAATTAAAATTPATKATAATTATGSTAPPTDVIVQQPSNTFYGDASPSSSGLSGSGAVPRLHIASMAYLLGGLILAWHLL
ncbi:hypothetical protein B0H16DRAFT_155669 [Mycena metata]|uniref:DUF5648 domain-containing protein n=1 Tax=Mycena metata TaxID=1033252 RepID=A0AAD7MVN3_9AGAR|nr:hypothetical protein B0H16DRAFT_155669 [Mycena metata]